MIQDNKVDIHDQLLEISDTFHKKLNCLLVENGPVELISRDPEDLFLFLASTIIGQQLSAKVAGSIWNKLVNLQKEVGVNLEDLFSDEHYGELRSCGISRSKIKAIVNLNESIKNKIIIGEVLLNSSYEEVIQKICSMWGLGFWSADMCAMFFCGLPDIYPKNDAAIKQGINLLCDETINAENELLVYSPYRTYICRHIWMGLDSGFLNKD